jgi:hypothetical protein
VRLAEREGAGLDRREQSPRRSIGRHTYCSVGRSGVRAEAGDRAVAFAARFSSPLAPGEPEPHDERRPEQHGDQDADDGQRRGASGSGHGRVHATVPIRPVARVAAGGQSRVPELRPLTARRRIGTRTAPRFKRLDRGASTRVTGTSAIA